MHQAGVSVVVCTFERPALLVEALRSLATQDLPEEQLEVVVVDDGSKDDTAERVRTFAAGAHVRVHYVKQAEGLKGVAEARNLGVQTARGDWVAFFDDDQRAEPDWLAQLLATAARHESACVGGSILADVTDEDRTALGPVCLGLLGEHRYSGTPAQLQGADIPSTGNLLIAREVFERVGHFDPETDSGEDTDFILRVRDAGFAVWSAPDAVVWHHVPPYRKTCAYLKWVSQRWGNNFALHDLHVFGVRGLCTRTIARLGQAALLFLPRYVWARLRRRHAEACDAWCRIRRVEAYARRCLCTLMPRLFAQEQFFEQLTFRSERERFANLPESVKSRECNAASRAVN